MCPSSARSEKGATQKERKNNAESAELRREEQRCVQEFISRILSPRER